MRINGILETALYVADPAVTAAFYRRLFGFSTLLESERLVALDVAGKNVLLLFRIGSTGEPFDTDGGIIPGHAGESPTHFAFSISAEDVEPWIYPHVPWVNYSGETDRRVDAPCRSLLRSHRPTRRTVFIQPPFLRWFEWPGCPYFAKAVTDFSLQMSVGPRKPVSGFTPASTWRRSEAALRTQQEPRPPFLRQHLSPVLTRGCCQPDLPMA